MFYKKEKDVFNIQYLGEDGITRSCIKAAALILSSEYSFQNAALITNNQNHLFILIAGERDYFVIKKGFTSGYDGEGPDGLAITLLLLEQHQLDIDEYEISDNLWIKLINMEIETNEIESILANSPIRPRRWYDYIFRARLTEHKQELSQYYPAVIPLALVDKRIIDLAITFSSNPDHALTIAYRRLEEIIRKRSDMTGEGAKLFSSVFLFEKNKDDGRPILTWDCPDDGEIKGRGNLFNAVYMAFRNARMHRELETSFVAELREFMLINELFNLEREAITPSLLAEKRKLLELDKKENS